MEGNWLETARDTDEGYFDTDPADADRMCFLPTDADTEGSQLPLTASYITPYPELNVEEADLFYQEGTPEVPFQLQSGVVRHLYRRGRLPLRRHAGGRGHPCPEVLSGRTRRAT